MLLRAIDRLTFSKYCKTIVKVGMSGAGVDYIKTPFFYYLFSRWVNKKTFKVKVLMRESIDLRNIKGGGMIFFSYNLEQVGEGAWVGMDIP